jgi:hypothetical protein
MRVDGRVSDVVGEGGRSVSRDVIGMEQMKDDPPRSKQRPSPAGAEPVWQSIDWYHPGQSRTFEVSGVQVTVRFVGNRGRRGRIAVLAPVGVKLRNMSGKSSATV